MAVSGTICSEAVLELPPGLAQQILERTGVAVAFFRPDGTWVSGAGGADSLSAAGMTADGPLSRLVRQAVERNEDCLETGPGLLRAAWLIRLRSRVVLVAAAELPACGGGTQDLGRRLMQAVAEVVRARVEGGEAAAQRDGMAEALSQSFEEVSLLHNLGEVLRVNRPVVELLAYVCSELCETTGAEAAAAWWPALGGAEPETVVVGRLPLGAADLPAVVEHILKGLGPEESVLVNNHCQADPVLAGFSMALERLVLVPLVLRDGVRGAIVAFNRDGQEFGSPDAKLIRSSANASAIFIENRRLYQELQEMMLDLVRALVSSVDAKDPYTCGHSERVATTSREIARQMNLGGELAETAYWAGLLHDIGKIGTPETILRKEGRLDPEERRIMEQHSEVGGRILGGIRKLQTLCQAVVHHHERPDGRGYPSGLRGEAIPLLARIVGLADAFDAMTSNRPYRPRLPLEHVKREIRENAGAQFDVRVVEAFFGLNLDRLMRLFEGPSAAVSASQRGRQG